jgi:hypothetical protein
MRGRSWLACAVAATLCGAAPASAGQGDAVAQLLGDLRAQGYREIWFERTLLNRVRITAERRGYDREIVIDPRTGEILRDYSELQKPRVAQGLFGAIVIRAGERDSGRSQGGDHDSDDHDSDDHDDHDD